jgi:threonine dehydrogenase-like Zn-dependent dehydrogenase
MLAAKKTGPERADVIEVAVPEVGPGHVLVYVRACAICASDLPEWSKPVVGPGRAGEWDADNSGMTGHEIAGEIVRVGNGVDESRLGERVWIDAIAGCGQCETCRDGRQTLCKRVSIVSQGFAEHVVAPARQCRPIPPGLDYPIASLIFDMAGTPMSAVKLADIKPGESVAVWGLGPVGLGLVQGALIAGAFPVIGLDPVASRRSRAESRGATVLDSMSPDSLSRLQRMTQGKGPDVVLCSVANQHASRQAFEALRFEGRMVTVAGFPPAGGEVRKWVSGSWGCYERDWPEVLEHVSSRRFVLDEYITHTFPLRQVERAFDIRSRDLEGSFKVVVTND